MGVKPVQDWMAVRSAQVFDDVGDGAGRVADEGGATEGLFEQRDEVGDELAVVVANVEDGRRLRGGWGAGEAGEDAGDDVVDVGEVALEGALVEEGDLAAGEDGFGEAVIGHVGAAPRSVDGEEAEAGKGHFVEVPVGVGDKFVGALGGGVERDGGVDAVRFREGELVVTAVDGG